MKLSRLLYVLLIASSVMQAQVANPDLNGRWAINRGDGHRLSVLIIEQNGSRVDGAWLPKDEPSSLIEDGRIFEGKLSFTIVRHETRYQVTGEMRGGRLQMDVASQGSKGSVHGEGVRQTSALDGLEDVF